MSVVLVTGSAGLVGSEAVRMCAERGLDVIGIDNDMRAHFFGASASTDWNRQQLLREIPRYKHLSADIRDESSINSIFKRYSKDIAGIVHCAAQPSHDWAARDPRLDFDINANGTLNLLEATRQHGPEAPFVFISTNKVYGDTPNRLPLIESETRWTVEESHPYAKYGIDEQMSVDRCLHSLFGVSKLAADVLVQEYGRYFDMNTVVFRGGCLTGPAHSGAELHGFLAYLMRCAVTQSPYTVYGYKGKQVRDNIHARDLVEMFWAYIDSPRPGEVYNAGGGMRSNCSMLEAIEKCEQRTLQEMEVKFVEENRTGDHIWYVSDTRKFERHYPDWVPKYDLEHTFDEIYEATRERFAR